jgi:hypothetical protein
MASAEEDRESSGYPAKNVIPVGEAVSPAKSAAMLTRTGLAGKFVSLVPLDSGRDVQDLYEVSHGNEGKERLWTYMAYGPFSSVEVMEDPLFLAVVDQATQKRVGMVSFANNVPAMRRIELAHIWYSPAYQRTAINTEAVYLMMRHVFDELVYRRVEWKCDALNSRSRQAALRLDFTFEGIFRKHMIVKGRNRDTAWFAMTDDEWPKVKRNLETWLYADGLDALALRRLSLTELNANSAG